MRILLIDVNCKYGSTGKMVYDLFTDYKKHGHQAAVCYGRGRCIKEPGIYKFGLDLETYIHAGLARLTGYNGCFSFFSTRRLIKYIETFKPDLIHIHELHAYFVNIAMLLNYIKRKGIRLVWTFHCEYMYTGKCGHSYECEKWKTECRRCPHLKDYPKTFFLDHTKQMFRWKKKLLNNLDFTIVTPSEWLAERVRQSFLGNKKIRVIHNGIDTSVFSPADADGLRKEWNIPKNHKVVFAAAPDLMSEGKGGRWVLELAGKMKERNVTFVLAGGKNVRKKDHVIETGMIKEKSQLALYYSMADVFVICSRREVFPTTCIEAQCCGTPVAGFDTGGTVETIV